VWLVAAAANAAYDPRFLGSGTAEFRSLGRTFVSVIAVMATASYAADLQIARGFVVVALALAFALSFSLRLVTRARLVQRRRLGQAMDRVLLVGPAASLPALLAAMRSEPAAGLQVVGVCLPADEAVDSSLRNALAGLGLPVLGELSQARDIVVRYAVDGVAVVAGDVGSGTVRRLGWALEGTGAELIVSSGLAEVDGHRLHVQSVGGVPLLRLDPIRFSGVSRIGKDVFDRVTALLAIVLLSPVLLALAALVRCTSRGPALYLQERVGRNGSRFRMVKFRSMRTGAHDEVAELAAQNSADGPLFKIPDDPRITRVGKWLRRFSLDELPQLLNVVTGSMSLVGPRPPLPSEVEQYESDVRRRLLVKPGLTGLWQVSGRSDLSWEDSVRLDLHYVENWSLAMDLQLLFKTARVVVKAKGAY
jgi:exopolysaccharide biosynthesis polyprenyl glycosylphosphotransferase